MFDDEVRKKNIYLSEMWHIETLNIPPEYFTGFISREGELKLKDGEWEVVAVQVSRLHKTKDVNVHFKHFNREKKESFTGV